MQIIRPVDYRIIPTIIIAVGTAFGGIFKQVRQLMHGITNLKQIGVIHLDTDGTRNFPHLATPFGSEQNNVDWGPNSFVHIRPPSRDFIDSINDGLRAGFENIPPTVFDTIIGEEGVGVGGIVILASATAKLHSNKCRGAIRRVFNRITNTRNEFNTNVDNPLVVHEVAGCLGGTWGTLDHIHEIIVDEAHRMSVTVSFQRTMLYPGVHLAKDPDGSLANAAAWTKEFSARASGRYVYLSHGNNGKVDLKTAPVMPTWIVSDTNNAPGKASTIETKALFSLMAHWFCLLLTTSFGRRLDQTMVDFRDNSLQTNARGERRVAQSIGFSHITLHRERVAQFVVKKSIHSTLEHWQSPANHEEVVQSTERFVRNQRLREGAGFSELSSVLRSDRNVDHVSRFRNLLEQNLGNYSGIELLHNALNISQVTQTQTITTAQTQMRAKRRALVEQVNNELDNQINRSIWNPELGVSATLDWIAEGKRIFNHMAGVAEDDHSVDEKLTRREEEVRTMEAEAIPRFLSMGWFRQWINRGSIQELGKRYIRAIRDLGSLRLEDMAKKQAIQVLEDIGEAFEARLMQVNRVMEELTSIIAIVNDEQDHLQQSDQTFINPKGIALDDNLEEIYGRVLSRPGDEERELVDIETRFAGELLLELESHHNLFELCKTPGQVQTELKQIIIERIRPQLQTLHVQTELLHRYETDEQLQQFFRERDREAFESITFDGCVSHDNPENVLRFFCGDSRRGSELVDILNQTAYVRANGNSQYEFVDTGNPEQLILIQIRLCVPPSSIGLYRVCRETYEQVRAEMTFESMHTDLVGPFLPEPGIVATAHDSRVALTKALAIDSLKLTTSNGSPAITFHRLAGEREPVTSDLAVFQRFNVRVETATRFWCAWRIHGPDGLRGQILRLGVLLKNAVENPTSMEQMVSDLINETALKTVLAELDWYDRNTNPNACSWNQGTP